MLAGDKAKSLLEGGSGLVLPPGGGSSTSFTNTWFGSGMGGSPKGPSWVHLTPWELKGLKVLLKWLEELSPNKRTLPKDISDHEQLLRDVKVSS